MKNSFDAGRPTRGNLPSEKTMHTSTKRVTADAMELEGTEMSNRLLECKERII